MSVIFFLFIFPSDIFFWKFIVHHEERKLPVSHVWFLFIHLICIHNDKLPCNLTCNFMQMWRACKSEHSKIEMEDYFETLKLLKPRLTFKSFLRVPHVSQSDSFLISLVTRRRKFLIFVFLSLTFNFCHHSNQLLHSLSLSRELKLFLRLLLHYFIMRTHPQSRHMAWKVSISMATLCCCVKADKR